MNKRRKRLLELIKRASKDLKTLDTALDILWTPAERDDFEDRIAILDELVTGKTQREVASKVNVSISKVTRGARAIRNSNGKVQDFLD